MHVHVCAKYRNICLLVSDRIVKYGTITKLGLGDDKKKK